MKSFLIARKNAIIDEISGEEASSIDPGDLDSDIERSLSSVAVGQGDHLRS
jgi:hypothetical protein